MNLIAALCISAPAFSAHSGAPSGQPHSDSITSVEALNLAFSLSDAGRALKVTYLSRNGVTDKGLVPVTAEVILPAGTSPAGGWPVVA